MEKKKYIKPTAEYVSFYSDEDIMSVLDINQFANEDDGSDGSASLSGVGGSIGGGDDVPSDWD